MTKEIIELVESKKNLKDEMENILTFKDEKTRSLESKLEILQVETKGNSHEAIQKLKNELDSAEAKLQAARKENENLKQDLIQVRKKNRELQQEVDKHKEVLEENNILSGRVEALEVNMRVL